MDKKYKFKKLNQLDNTKIDDSTYIELEEKPKKCFSINKRTKDYLKEILKINPKII